MRQDQDNGSTGSKDTGAARTVLERNFVSGKLEQCTHTCAWKWAAGSLQRPDPIFKCGQQGAVSSRRCRRSTSHGGHHSLSHSPIPGPAPASAYPWVSPHSCLRSSPLAGSFQCPPSEKETKVLRGVADPGEDTESGRGSQAGACTDQTPSLLLQCAPAKQCPPVGGCRQEEPTRVPGADPGHTARDLHISDSPGSLLGNRQSSRHDTALLQCTIFLLPINSDIPTQQPSTEEEKPF